MGGRRNFRNERRCGVRNSVMFTNTRGNRSEHNSTSRSNSSQGYPVLGNDGQLYRHTECYVCHCYGKISYQCTDKKPKSINMAIIGVMLMHNGDAINKTWIILNICSTDSVTNNLDYFEDVNNCAKDEKLAVLKNGGFLQLDRKGLLTFLPLSVHVDDNYLPTILSLKYVNNILGVRVTMDTLMKKFMNVILSDGTIFKFK